MYWPKLEFHKLVLHPNFCVRAMGLLFYAQIGVSHYLRPVINSKLIYTGPRTHDVLAQTGVSH